MQIIQNKLLLLSISLFIILSCEDDDTINNVCSVENPIEDLSWLKAKIQDLKEVDFEYSKYFYVSQAKYNGLTVFIFANCCPLCNTVTSVYNCEGNNIGQLGVGDDFIDSSILDNGLIVWKPDGFSCAE